MLRFKMLARYSASCPTDMGKKQKKKPISSSNVRTINPAYYIFIYIPFLPLEHNTNISFLQTNPSWTSRLCWGSQQLATVTLESCYVAPRARPTSRSPGGGRLASWRAGASTRCSTASSSSSSSSPSWWWYHHYHHHHDLPPLVHRWHCQKII